MGHPVDDLAVGVQAEEALVLAHQPVPVVAALGVRVGDAHQRPVDGDLVRPRGSVRSARPRVWTTAGRGGRDAVTSARPVIRRASQPSPSSARVPTRTLRCPSSKYAVTRPTQSRLSHGPRRLLSVVDPASGSSRLSASVGSGSDVEGQERARRSARRRSVPVTSIGARTAGLRAGHQRVEHRVRRPDCWSITPVRSAGRVAPAPLVVAEHQHPQAVAEVAVLGPDDRHDRVGLGLGPGQHPVDGAAAAADPALGPLVAHRRQRPAYRLDDLLSSAGRRSR